MEKLPGVRFLVLHDLDKAGFSILGTLTRSTRRYHFARHADIVDLGIRLADVTAEGLDSEPVDYPENSEHNLRENGATEAEIAFMVEGQQRVELNAFDSDHFIAWLERKLMAHGVTKFVPDDAALTAAYRRATFAQAINVAIDEGRKAAEDRAAQVVCRQPWSVECARAAGASRARLGCGCGGDCARGHAVTGRPAPMRVCATPNCPALTSETYCTHCRGVREHQRRDTRRTASGRRGRMIRYYDTREWKDLRDEVYRQEPFCRTCGRLTEEIDHIISRQRGGGDSQGSVSGFVPLLSFRQDDGRTARRPIEMNEQAARIWCQTLARTLGVQHIRPNGVPYLDRYYAAGWDPASRQRGPAIFLHHFLASDPSDEVHSHPWNWSASLILVGGYREHRCDPAGGVLVRDYRPGDVNVILPNGGSGAASIC